jgi:mannose-1-phosphate guanylyltransferase
MKNVRQSFRETFRPSAHLMRWTAFKREDFMAMGNGSGNGRPWSIVLAGGKGERLASFTERWLGRYVPKQYCAFTGTRSMLEHTLDRTALLSRPEETVTVIAREHQSFARNQVKGGFRNGLVVQPVNRDTAAGVFLPVARVRHLDPEATVAIFPSDHFIYPEGLFLRTVRAAVEAAEELPHRLVLLGVTPDDSEPDYGWIFPGRELLDASGRAVRAVRSFLEKPTSEDAAMARSEGALWNTMVMAAKVKTLWRLGWRYVPDVMFRFENFLEAMGTPLEPRVLTSIYGEMPQRNFSSDLLQRARNEVAVIELRDVVWSDWGRAERIEETLARVGRRPAWEHRAPATLPLAVAG